MRNPWRTISKGPSGAGRGSAARADEGSRTGVVMSASYDAWAVEPRLADVLVRGARRAGTPYYLYDLPRMDADTARLSAAFPDPWLRLYSLKANGLPGLVGRMAGAGFGATVVSAGELAS